MKTQEELNTIKEELEALSRKLQELTEGELEQVSGGGNFADLEQMTNVPEQYSASIKIEGGQHQRKP